jgi:poly(3-hydroxyalkanoate) synthetase
MHKLNDALQWAGTVCFLSMYTIMSFYKELDITEHETVQLIAGCMGGMFFLAWSLRVANKQQMIVNVASITITLVGLFKALG